VATVTVKGVRATAAQQANILLLCQIAKGMGATNEQMAGALATMMQESACINLQGGDRDSAGLFQQRPSQGWGSYAQVTTPSHAIGAFLSPYLTWCKKGMSVLAASNAVQRSAYPNAPAQWLPESRRDVQLVLGSSDFGDVSSSLSGKVRLITTTRANPYEFSRGSPGQKETSWDCIGRLAQEVNWDRFMRGGTLWFVSEDWLSRQTPRYTFAEYARGVLAITHDADARRPAAEATVTAVADRWSVLPGDVVNVVKQGPANGLWLVSTTHRSIYDPTTEIQLKRPTQKKDEPANTTTSTTTSIGTVKATRLKPSQVTGGAAAGPSPAQVLYDACQKISDRNYPYVWGGGHGSAGTPSGGGFDCSGSVVAALAAAGLGYRLGGPVDVSGTIAARWGRPGRGRWFTVWASAEHVWIQFTGLGPAWRFDTSPWNCGPDGPRMRSCPRSTSGFTARCWPGL
jgi:hypothetical protein